MLTRSMDPYDVEDVPVVKETGSIMVSPGCALALKPLLLALSAGQMMIRCCPLVVA